MLSSRSLYSNELEFYRRSDQREISLGHASSLGDQYDTNSQVSRNNSPQSDPDNKSAPPRKRVPVACGRCRKRKIKCSGDEGGNRGCSNCRNAGFAGCQFLRVQSSELPMSGQYQALKGWQMSHRFSPYSSGIPSRFRPFATSQYLDSTTYGGVPTTSNFDPYLNSTSLCSWKGPSYSPNYALPYTDESASQYGSQPPPPSYMLPNTDPMNNMNSCYLSGSLGRIQQQTLWTDQVSSASLATTMATSNGSHINSVYGLQSADNSTPFQAVNSSSTDRVLPTPSASRALPAAPQTSLDTGHLSAFSYRSSSSWNTGTPSSTSGSSSRTSNSTDNDSRIVSAGASQDLPFSYDVSSSTQDLTNVTASTAITNSPQDFRRSSDGSYRVRTTSRESNSLISSPKANHYIHASINDRHHHSRTGQLTTGQPYHSLSTLSMSRGPTLQDCTADAVDWQGHSQRNSVA